MVCEKHGQGFIIVELAVAALLLLMSVCWASASYQAYCNHYYREQVRFIAAGLASELRHLQKESMFRNDRMLAMLKASSAQPGQYVISTGITSADKRYVRFADQGCGNVYFSRMLASLHFSSTGNPSASGNFELRNRRLSNFYCVVSVQPVTGRVVINEY